MKIGHSMITLTVLIFFIGSMITVGMDLKKRTTNVSMNVIEAKKKHNENKEAYLMHNKKYKWTDKEAMVSEGRNPYKKATYKIN